MKPRRLWGSRATPNQREMNARHLAWIAAVTFALAVVVSSFHLPVVEAQAGHIDSISPSCASVGDQVTITGQGFGAHNVSIAVGGVQAQVVGANGHSATFIVPAGAPLGSTTVTATNPGGHTGSIAFKVCDLLMPEAWGGEWEIVTTYSNATTGSVTATDDITTFIRTGEPFGLTPAVKAGNCAGSVSDAHLEIQCTGQATTGTCTLGTSAQVSADLSGDSLSGAGTVTISATGNCAPLLNAPQTIQRNIQISGQRLSLSEGPPDSSMTLVKTFVPFAGLIGAGQ